MTIFIAKEKSRITPVILVACSKQKNKGKMAAQDLYTGAMFVKAKALARLCIKEGRAAKWFILSAKHHLLAPQEVIRRYDCALAEKNAAEKKQWAKATVQAIHKNLPKPRPLIFLTPAAYWQNLLAPLERNGYRIKTPLKGLKQGEQLQWANKRLAAKKK